MRTFVRIPRSGRRRSRECAAAADRRGKREVCMAASGAASAAPSGAASGEAERVLDRRPVAAPRLNAIPFSAVDRVEVLKDGASAVYGADAVAGVINFILRQDFTGVQATAYYGNSTRGGGLPSTTQGNATLGWGDITKDRYNIFGMLSWQQSKALDAVDRNFSNSSVNTDTGLESTSGNPFPANVGTPAHAPTRASRTGTWCSASRTCSTPIRRRPTRRRRSRAATTPATTTRAGASSTHR
jgi:outer membrane receptor protein involved in Fe transport